jgi:hypothetical protein
VLARVDSITQFYNLSMVVVCFVDDGGGPSGVKTPSRFWVVVKIK